MHSIWQTFKTAQRFDQLSAAVFAGMACVIVLTFQDYGLAWDEPFGEHYGTLIVDYIISGGADQRVFEFRNLQHYGGLFDGLANLMTRVSPLEPFHTRHLLTALTGLIGAGGVWAMARRLGGAAAGFWALGIVLAMPTYTGHMFFNPKDIPFAAGTIWALYFAMRVMAAFPRVDDKTALGLGVALGATMGVRIGGGVLVAYVGALLALHFAWRQGRTDSSVRAASRAVLITLVTSIVLTFALWPSSWPFLFDKAIEALLITAKFKFDVDILFDGVWVSSLNLPSTYVPGYALVKLPDAVLVLFIMSVPLAIGRFVRAFGMQDRMVVFGYAALALGVFFPPLFAMWFKSAHYDALRHFIFVLPPLAALVGVEVAGVLAWFSRRQRIFGTISGLVVAAGLTFPVAEMVRLHPYAYTYYNQMAGGVAGAQGRYELDYWATSYREAARWLRKADAVPKSGTVKVYVCGPTDSAARFLPARFEIVKNIDQAHFFIGFTRWTCDSLVDAPTVYSVTRAGARFVSVKDLRGGFRLLGRLPMNVRIVEDYPRHEQN